MKKIVEHVAVCYMIIITIDELHETLIKTLQASVNIGIIGGNRKYANHCTQF